MKTAISIPDPIFQEAEEIARRLGLSRSQLYAKAVAEYIAEYKGKGVTEALDRIYAEEDSRLDRHLAAMQAATISQETW